MRVYIVRVGDVVREVLEFIQVGLERVFYRGFCVISEHVIEVPSDSYNRVRQQYVSEPILNEVLRFALNLERETGESCIVLGVTDVDIYAPGMNFIFGEAQCPGKAAIISLFRLRPEFYGEGSNKQLFMERAVKEAVHEIGHTLGLRHCGNPVCVMHFSLHIGMTDRKTSKFCRDCMIKLKTIVTL